MQRTNNKRQSWVKSDSKGKRKRRNGARPRTIGQSIDKRVGVYQRAGIQALRDLNSLRRFINAEFHYIDQSAAQVNSTTTPTFYLLNGCQVGDTVATRTGQSIKMDRCHIKYYINSNATSIQNVLRILVVLDKQPNAAIFAAGDLLTASTPVNPYTFGSQGRFVIFFDETFALSSNGSGVICQSMSLPVNQHVVYNTGNAGTVADINTNSVYLIHLSDQAANPPSVTFQSRLWFIDN